MALSSSPAHSSQEMMDLVRDLYPICRSITGDGVRETLRLVSRWLPLEIHEVPSGTAVFDWAVPDEWNITGAYIETMSGERIVDFRDNNLHVLNYSTPVDGVVSREELEAHLFSSEENPDWVPYRTSYYTRRWGFCLTHSQRVRLNQEKYRVKVDSSLATGSLTYGEIQIPGQSRDEIVIYTHVCHPSLCNDNLSGISVAAAVGRALMEQPARRYGYRLVFAPGTIGSITWLSKNRDRLRHVCHGLVVGLLGDAAPHTYKRTRDGAAEIDAVAEHVLRGRSDDNRFLDFSPYGYDERQFGSPGINLPVGRLTRSVNGGYPQYHTSADNLDLISAASLQESVDVVLEIMEALQENRRFINLQPYCEPQLGKRGLYRNTGGVNIADRENAMLWLLNQSDGTKSLLDIAKKSGNSFDTLVEVAAELVDTQLLEERPDTRE